MAWAPVAFLPGLLGIPTFGWTGSMRMEEEEEGKPVGDSPGGVAHADSRASCLGVRIPLCRKGGQGGVNAA